MPLEEAANAITDFHVGLCKSTKATLEVALALRGIQRHAGRINPDEDHSPQVRSLLNMIHRSPEIKLDHDKARRLLEFLEEQSQDPDDIEDMLAELEDPYDIPTASDFL